MQVYILTILLCQFLFISSATMIDYIKKLKLNDSNKVLIKDPDEINRKIGKLIEGGYTKLQVISDYDKTITKQHVNGKTQFHAFDLFKQCPSISQEIRDFLTALTNKYAVIDKDPNLSHAERSKHMDEWWNKTIEAYKGLKISQEEIEKTCLELGPPLRDNVKELFEVLKQGNVPVLLLSGGIGDCLEPSLRISGINGSNIELVANYIKRDNEGRIQDYKAPPIHTVNKNEYIKNTQHYKKHTNRPNVLLMGDHLGDAQMVNSLEHVGTVIKIGFSYNEAEVVLPTWLNTFDIVLKDDQSMNVPKAIVELLKKE
uniref:5'-nucleotidase n=2 Tax=Diabrotica virgifera virgifera TaxID=50390 RepID=A0A6P7FBL4_DIAVI